jgi:hypothetical protein
LLAAGLSSEVVVAAFAVVVIANPRINDAKITRDFIVLFYLVFISRTGCGPV